MSLPFNPACTPLLLGGLPHRSAGEALEFARRIGSGLLAWPALPRLNRREQSLTQSALGFPGLTLDASSARVYVDRKRAERELDQLTLAYLESDSGYAMLAPEDASTLYELLRQGEAGRGIRALIGQTLGPISLALQLTDEQQRPLIYDDMLFDAITQHLRLRLMWQEASLSELGDVTILCLNEPLLDAVGQPFLPLEWDDARARLDDVLGGVIGCKGIAAGGAVDWKEVLQTSAELIVADIWDHAAALLAAAAPLAAFVKRTGVVGLGIVPADADSLRQISIDQLTARLIALLDQLQMEGLTTDMLLPRTVLALSGPLDHLDLRSAERALQLLGELSTRLRARYQLI